MNQVNSSPAYMEWETMRADMGLQVIITHSTPLSSRPVPTTSPNRSAIDMDLEEEIWRLTERLAELKLD